MLPFALKWARHQAGMTLAELAAASGVSLSYIAHMERGARRNPSLVKVKAIAQALSVEPTELVVLLAAPRQPRRATDPASTPSRAALTADSNLR